MTAASAAVKLEMDALRGSSLADLEALRLATAAEMRGHIDTLAEVADVPDATIRIKARIDALQARLDAIAALSPLSFAPTQPPAAESAPQPTLFNPTIVWGPTPDSQGANRTALLVGALALAAILLLMRKS